MNSGLLFDNDANQGAKICPDHGALYIAGFEEVMILVPGSRQKALALQAAVEGCEPHVDHQPPATASKSDQVVCDELHHGMES